MYTSRMTVHQGNVEMFFTGLTVRQVLQVGQSMYCILTEFGFQFKPVGQAQHLGDRLPSHWVVECDGEEIATDRYHRTHTEKYDKKLMTLWFALDVPTRPLKVTDQTYPGELSKQIMANIIQQEYDLDLETVKWFVSNIEQLHREKPEVTHECLVEMFNVVLKHF